ncbi:MAG: SIR2 family protein [Patescibacteria group bacterium]
MSQVPDPVRILADYLRQGRLMFFLGAGVGIDAGLPSAAQLARLIAKRFELPPTDDLGMVAERFLGTGRMRVELDAFVQNTLKESQKAASRQPYELFRDLERIDNIVTTNYDTLLETVHDSTHLEVVTCDQDIPQADQRPTSRKLYKIYGCINRAGPYCLTDSDIEERCVKYLQLVLPRIVTLCVGGPLVFVGFRGRDANCIRWFLSLKASGQKPLLFVVNPHPHLEDVGRFRELAEVVPVPMNASEFFRALRSHTQALQTNEPVVGRALARHEKETLPEATNPFLFWKTDQIPDDSLVVSLFINHPTVTGTVTSPGNTILLGGRGTGKSMLLRALTTRGHLETMADPSALATLAVYVKLGRDIRMATQRLTEENPGQWRLFYQHYLNLVVAESIMECLCAVCNRFPTLLAGARTLRDICVLLRLTDDAAEVPLQHLPFEIRKARSLIDRSRIDASACTGATTVSDLVSLLTAQVPPLARQRLVLMIDDFEGSDEQFDPIASWISARRFDVKVACAYSALSGAALGTLQPNEDYRIADLDHELLFGGASQRYPHYVEDIANRRLSNFGSALASIRELLPAFETPPESGYAGFNEIVRLSSGHISKFLELCKDIVTDAQGSVNVEPKRLSSPIDVRIQSRVISDHSHVFSSETRRGGAAGHRIGILLDSLAEYSKRRAEKTSQRTLRFVVTDPGNLDVATRELLEGCLTLGVLQRANLRQSLSPAQLTPMSAYRLHRLLCPRYHLSLEDHHQRELQAKHLKLAVENPQGFLAALLPSDALQMQLPLAGESEVPNDERI